MTKKQLGVFLVVVIIFILAFLSYRYLFNKPNLNVKNTKEISITALPSPPKVKKVINQVDIEKFASFFNSIMFTPTIHQNSKGWQIKIETNGSERHTIYFVGNKVCFDGIWYSIKNDVTQDMNNLYQILDYPEKSVTSNTN